MNCNLWGDGICRESQSAAYDMIRDWSLDEHRRLREEAPRFGLRTAHRGGTLKDIAQQVQNGTPSWNFQRLHACRNAAD